MAQASSGPDPLVDSDRLRGSTAPESGSESSNVAGRPATEKPEPAFHERNETSQNESEPLDEKEALAEGGSFDGVAALQDLGSA